MVGSEFKSSKTNPSLDIIYDTDQLCQFLKKYEVTRMLFTPSLLETILDTQTDELLDQAFKKFRSYDT